MKGKKHSEETKRKIGEASKNRSHKPCSEETKRKISEAKKGKKLSEEHIKALSKAKRGKDSNRKGVQLSDETKEKISDNRRGKLMGDKNPSWKGGITPKTVLIRNSPEYAEWRNRVFERDNYTCQDCGERGCYLHAHHIILMSENIDLSLGVDNGKTLCIKYHGKYHENVGFFKGDNK